MEKPSIPDVESDFEPYDDEEALSKDETIYRHQRMRSSPSWMFTWFLVVVSAGLSSWLTTTSRTRIHCHCGRDNSDLNTAPPSVIASIDRSYHIEWFAPFNYSSSPWTEDPEIVGDKVDRMWQSLGLDGTHFMIPKSQGKAFHLDVRRHAMIPKEDSGLEEDVFLAWFEHLHLLHCLNGIRKHLWYNNEYYSANNTTPLGEKEIIHSNHCLDALRESIMCNADIGIVPQIWTSDRQKDHPVHLPDFDRPHVCHNYDTTRQWMYDHMLPPELRQKGVTMLPGQIITQLDKRPA